MVKKFTKEGRSCEEFIEEFEARMKLLIRNFPDLVETYKVVYGCKFKEFLKNRYSPDFKSSFFENDLYKERQFFSRLTPRHACLPGQKILLQLRWSKIDFPNQKFYYWDLNMAYTYALKKFRYESVF